MNARQRSLSGLILAIILVPILAGLLACIDLMPVPLGNPEESRVDPWFDGLWLLDEGEAVWVFQPYDEHTWLLTIYAIDDTECEQAAAAAAEAAEANEAANTDSESARGSTDEEVIQIEPVGEPYAYEIEELRAAGQDCLSGEIDGIAKAWVTNIGPGEFMTWEVMGAFDEDRGFAPEAWFALGISRTSDDEFRLRLIDTDFDGFDTPKIHARLDRLEVEGPRDPRKQRSARRAIERVISRNVETDELYVGDAEWVFLRIKPEDFEVFVGDIVPRS